MTEKSFLWNSGTVGDSTSLCDTADWAKIFSIISVVGPHYAKNNFLPVIGALSGSTYTVTVGTGVALCGDTLINSDTTNEFKVVKPDSLTTRLVTFTLKIDADNRTAAMVMGQADYPTASNPITNAYMTTSTTCDVARIILTSTTIQAVSRPVTEYLITSVKPGTITASKLASGTISTNSIGAQSVDGDLFVDNSISASAIASGAIISDKLADSVIDTSKLVTQSVLSSKLADGSVTGSKISAGSISAAKIVDNSILEGNLQDSSFTGAFFPAGTITPDRLVESRYEIKAGKIIMWNGAVGTIPAGWYMCNGQTLPSGKIAPDLRDRFIVGVGTAYSLGANGGVASSIYSHSHPVTLNVESSHTHTVDITDGGASTHTHNGTTQVGFKGYAYAGQTHGPFTSGGFGNGGSHTHQITGTTSGGTDHNHAVTLDSVSSTVSLLPPYYAVYFIIKG